MTMSSNHKVVVGMSGGVDSSVAALLLCQADYDVTGIMLRLWTEPGKEDKNTCCTPEAIAAARRVAAILGIPFYVIDVKDLFERQIVEYFIAGYRDGETPNPCIRCNQFIRWGALLREAENLGAEFLATGHYARLETNTMGKVSLRKGLDERKDQSYVLSGLTQDQLQKTLLPIGGLEKSAVRELASKHNLPSAERPDSQDLCFLAGGDYRDFLKRQAPDILTPGQIMNMQGEIVGEHNGLANYTIGQRKGLGASNSPNYVISKEILSNTLWVGKNGEIGANTFFVENVNWCSGQSPKFPITLDVKIRYKALSVQASIDECENGTICVKFDRKLRDITPGQQAAFYNEDYCLGGGKISRVLNR